MWNSWEFASLSQASEKAQRPLLTRALREIKNGSDFERKLNQFNLGDF